MFISPISHHNSFSVARKIVKIKQASAQVKTACIPQHPETQLKKAIPGVILLAESLTLPLNAPSLVKNANELTGHIISVKNIKPLLNETEQDATFANIKSMINVVDSNVSDKFVSGIVETSQKVKCSPEDLNSLLYIESKFNPKAKRGNFVGLGQMNSKSLKLSVDYAKNNHKENSGINPKITINQFAQLSREEQMPYVKNYILAMKDFYIKNKTKNLTGGELYGLFYVPSRVNLPYLTSATDRKTAKYYASNRALDFNGDNKITKDDLQQVIDNVTTNVLSQKKK